MRSVVDRKVVMRRITVLIHNCLAVVQRVRVTDQALPIHCSASNLPAAQYVLRITAFCIVIYEARRRFSSFELLCIFVG